MRRLPNPLVVALLLAILAVAGVACGGSDTDDADASDRTPTSVRIEPDETSSTTAAPATATSDPADDDAASAETEDQTTTAPPAPIDEPDTLPATSLRLVEVASVAFPTTLIARPGSDDLWVAERRGRILHLRRNGSGFDLVPDAALDIVDLVDTGGEGGLLGMTFSADGQFLYVSYTNLDLDSVIAEYAMSGDEVDAGSARILLTVEQPFGNHNGGQIERGPDDLLYVALGDGGGGGDPLDSGQDTSTLLGSILRIDPQNPAGETAYGIPADNPFADGSQGRPEIWLYGVRNPWRFSFDRATGDLWIGDVGQSAVEEITHLPADGGLAGRGANLGWRLVEGDQPYQNGSPPPDHVAPIHTYGRDGGGCSVTGGYVYRGQQIPELVGAYLYGDFCTARITAVRDLDDGGLLVGDIVTDRNLRQIVSFGEDADGEIYVLGSGGSVSRLEAG